MCRKLNLIRKAIPLAAALALGGVMCASSGIALAQSQSDEVVRFNDLNLNTPAGIHELANRIETAAWQVCVDVIPPRSTGPSNIANTRCQEAVTKETVDKVNIPALTSMFEAVPVDDNLTSD